MPIKYFRSDKNARSPEVTLNPKLDHSSSVKNFEVVQSSTSNVGAKFSSRNSKQNTNTDTICSIISKGSKKGSNVNSITSDKDKKYYEMYKIMRNENK